MVVRWNPYEAITSDGASPSRTRSIAIMRMVSSVPWSSVRPSRFMPPWNPPASGCQAFCCLNCRLVSKWLLTFSEYGSAPGQNQKSEFMDIAFNQLYLPEAGNHRVDVFDLSGKFLFNFGGLGTEPGK